MIGWSESATELFANINRTTLYKGLLKGPPSFHPIRPHYIELTIRFVHPSRIQYNKLKSNRNRPSTAGYVPFSICSTFLVPFLTSWPILFDYPISLSALSWCASWGCDGVKNVAVHPRCKGHSTSKDEPLGLNRSWALPLYRGLVPDWILVSAQFLECAMCHCIVIVFVVGVDVWPGTA